MEVNGHPRGQRIPGSKGTEVKGHGITYRSEEDASAASFLYAAYNAQDFEPRACEHCGGWHLERRQ